jgi:hypothetical protein
MIVGDGTRKKDGKMLKRIPPGRRDWFSNYM